MISLGGWGLFRHVAPHFLILRKRSIYLVSGCCFFSVYQGKWTERTKAGLSLNCKILYSEKSQVYIYQPLNSFLGITSTHYTREPVRWGAWWRTRVLTRNICLLKWLMIHWPNLPQGLVNIFWTTDQKRWLERECGLLPGEGVSLEDAVWRKNIGN